MILRSPYRPLEQALGYRFRRRALLETALTHPSFRHETEGASEDNQRLEFLGDAVLALVVADHVFQTRREHDEGDLTMLRSRVTSTPALAQIARTFDLGQYLRLGRGEQQSDGAHRTTTLADALEAVLGAAYLDGGLKAVQKIFKKLFLPLLAQVETDDADNPKGNLQEFCQKMWKINPDYRVTATAGPSHARTYTVEAVIRDQVYGSGTGPSKRAAESAAARHALEQLR